MDCLTFIAKIIEFCIWPIVCLLIVFLVRGKLFTLIGSISKFRAKDFEFEFTKQIEEIEQIQGKNVEISIDKKLKTMASDNPTMAIIEAWKFVEIELTNHAKKLLGTEKDYNDLIKQISFHNLLGYQKLQVIERMKKLRNEVIHSNDLSITKSDALNYARNCSLIVEDFKRISEVPKIKLTMLTLLILEVNHMIDTGKYASIGIEEIEKQISNETLIEYLAKISKGDSDFSIFLENNLYYEYIKRFNKEIKGLRETYGGDELRKWGVENSGLCLVIAWTNEIIQRGTGWNPTLFET